jgi:hypothetical protein
MFLPSVFGLSGHGASARRSPEHCGMEHDPRPRRLRPRAEPRCVGELAGNYGLATGDWNQWRLPSSGWRVLRILMSSRTRRPGLRGFGRGPVAVERRVDLLRHRDHIQRGVKKLLDGFRNAERLTQHVVVFDTMHRYVRVVS